MSEKCYTEPVKDVIIFKGLSTSEKDKSFHSLSCGEKIVNKDYLKSMTGYKTEEKSMHVIKFGDRIKCR